MREHRARGRCGAEQRLAIDGVVVFDGGVVRDHLEEAVFVGHLSALYLVIHAFLCAKQPEIALQLQLPSEKHACCSVLEEQS